MRTLTNLPTELLYLISNNLPPKNTIHNLGLINKRLYTFRNELLNNETYIKRWIRTYGRQFNPELFDLIDRYLITGGLTDIDDFDVVDWKGMYLRCFCYDHDIVKGSYRQYVVDPLCLLPLMFDLHPFMKRGFFDGGKVFLEDGVNMIEAMYYMEKQGCLLEGVAYIGMQVHKVCMHYANVLKDKKNMLFKVVTVLPENVLVGNDCRIRLNMVYRRRDVDLNIDYTEMDFISTEESDDFVFDAYGPDDPWDLVDLDLMFHDVDLDDNNFNSFVSDEPNYALFNSYSHFIR